MEALVQATRWLADEDSETTDATATEESTTTDEGKRLAGAIVSNVLLFFLIFGMSATVDCKNVKKQISNKFAIGVGLGTQFIIMPFLGFIAVKTFSNATGFTDAVGITLLVVTSSPGGSYSNWWCSLFNADLPLSVAMTTCSSLVSIVMLPLNLFIYTYLVYGAAKNEKGESILQQVDFPTLFYTLAIVMFAICSGIYAGYKWDAPRFHVLANKLGSICGIMLIIFSIFLSSGGDGTEAKLWNQHWSFYVAVAFPCLMGMLMANICARCVKLSPPEVVAVAIECCYQNTGIATSVAITMFSDKEERAQAIAVPLFYGLVSAVGIFIFCLVSWKMGWTKAPSDENICVVINKSYEIVDHDDDQSKNDESEGSDDEADQDIEECADADAKKAESALSTPDTRRRIDTAETSLSDDSSISPVSTPSKSILHVPEVGGAMDGAF